MIITRIAAPGDAFGPCRHDCNHLACENMRYMSARICSLCGSQIGYGIAYLENPNDRGHYVHHTCYLTHIEEETEKWIAENPQFETTQRRLLNEDKRSIRG